MDSGVDLTILLKQGDFGTYQKVIFCLLARNAVTARFSEGKCTKGPGFDSLDGIQHPYESGR